MNEHHDTLPKGKTDWDAIMFDIMPKQNKINCFFFINLSTLTYPQILTLLRDENLKTNYELRNMNFIVYGILMKIEMIFENI